MISTYPILSCQSASLLAALLVCICAYPAAFCLSKVFIRSPFCQNWSQTVKKSAAVFDVAGFGGFVLVSGQNDSSKIHFPRDQVQDFMLRFKSEWCKVLLFKFQGISASLCRYLIV